MDRNEELRPFKVDVAEAELVGLRERLAAVRWPPRPGSAEDQAGVARTRVEEIVRYWRDEYDWRTWETRLNQYPQLTTTIDGTNVHFLHVRSPELGAVPLILSHGWPGSVVEFIDVIGPLSDPRQHGLDPQIAFHLVIPSLPGFAWSGPTPDAGWGPRRIARAFATLMDRLGYHRYGAVGNDWDSHIAPEIGRVVPGSAVGVHVTQLFSFPAGEWLAYPPGVEPDTAPLTAADRAALAGLREIQRCSGAYAHVHAQEPDLLGLALTDSPVGLLAWNSQAMGDLDPETLLTHITIYWLTRTATSAMKLYAEYARQPPADGPTSVPLALAQFQCDIQAIRAYAERDHVNIVSWNTYNRGGHYAAHQAADLLIEDIRTFFATSTGSPSHRDWRS